ncbi:MAG: hypothetical protein U0270_15880 [Labilithrix sp.]
MISSPAKSLSQTSKYERRPLAEKLQPLPIARWSTRRTSMESYWKMP